MDLFPPTLVEMVKEAEREVALRRRVYPRRIAAGQMTRAAADRQIQIMEAIVTTLARMVAQQ